MFRHKLIHHVFEGFITPNQFLKITSLNDLSSYFSLNCFSKLSIRGLKAFLDFTPIVPYTRPPDTASFKHLYLPSRSLIASAYRNRLDYMSLSQTFSTSFLTVSNTFCFSHICKKFFSGFFVKRSYRRKKTYYKY